jgi:hypothetical protein
MRCWPKSWTSSRTKPAPVPKAEAAPRQQHRVQIEPIGGDRYRAYYQGRLLCESRDPERDACRVLVGMGLRGSLTSYRGEMPCLILHDIERSAKRMATGSSVVPYNAKDRPAVPVFGAGHGGRRTSRQT